MDRDERPEPGTAGPWWKSRDRKIFVMLYALLSLLTLGLGVVGLLLSWNQGSLIMLFGFSVIWALCAAIYAWLSRRSRRDRRLS